MACRPLLSGAGLAVAKLSFYTRPYAGRPVALALTLAELPGLPWNLSEALGAERFDIRVKWGDAAVGWRRGPARVIVEKRL